MAPKSISLMLDFNLNKGLNFNCSNLFKEIFWPNLVFLAIGFEMKLTFGSSFQHKFIKTQNKIFMHKMLAWCWRWLKVEFQGRVIRKRQKLRRRCKQGVCKVTTHWVVLRDDVALRNKCCKINKWRTYKKIHF